MKKEIEELLIQFKAEFDKLYPSANIIFLRNRSEDNMLATYAEGQLFYDNFLDIAKRKDAYPNFGNYVISIENKDVSMEISFNLSLFRNCCGAVFCSDMSIYDEFGNYSDEHDFDDLMQLAFKFIEQYLLIQGFSMVTYLYSEEQDGIEWALNEQKWIVKDEFTNSRTDNIVYMATKHLTDD